MSRWSNPSSRRGFLGRTGGLAATAGLAAALGDGLTCRDGSAGRPPAGRTQSDGTTLSDGTTPRGAATGYPAPGTITADDLVDAGTLWSWTERMAGHGPRLPGSDAHRRHIDDLAERLAGYGLTVTRHPTRLSAWLADSWSLRVVDGDGRSHTVPVAAYRPHSGETPARGVTAAVVDVGAGDEPDYRRTPVAGAIVLADGAVARLSASVLGDLADHVHPPEARSGLANEDYSRVWLGVPPQPSLETARRHGAVAMIEILHLSPALAAGQYTPHQQEHAALPTLHVDAEQGARLRSLLARGPLTATLTLTASRRETTVDYLTALLPGSGAPPPAPARTRAPVPAPTPAGPTRATGAAEPRLTPGAVLVATHTDGQNAVEENGGPALLALAEYFSRFPARDRPRDLLFLFSPNHMVSEAATVKPDAWLRGHPEIMNNVAMALAAEHLGTMAWDDRGGTAAYRPTGRSELVTVPVGHSDTLRELAIDEVKASDLTRSAVLRPFQNGLYGEGTFPYRLGIPTIAFISGPAYLVQVAPGDNLDKLDRALLHRHTLFLARLLSRMLALPTAKP
ncbi:hypothetical protein FF36_03981 [Frankia torreyi]|uniref:Uncharacterized protein n=1 Tax=Frankia torreyi TaxID=1856 RepID=A0A0D8BBI4_9ACTN|nr:MULTISPECIES: hypothetical protein [Frankia]KJE21648.1 hypothetical protein FF36_03981 [Frankia torreyi]